MKQELLLVVLATLAIEGCSSENEQPEESSLDPGPGAFAGDFETSDDFFTRMSEPAEGLAASPHGVVQIWYSANLGPAVEMDTFKAPEGSVAIKTQAYEDGAYTEILVMLKGESGSSPDTDDWIYEVRDAEGMLVGPSDQTFCAACHLGFPDQDGLVGITLSN